MISKENKPLLLAPGAFLLGNYELGENVNIWYNAVIRGSGKQCVYIGDNTNIQDNCTVHVEYNTDVHIGNGVTIGHNAIVHGCTIGDNTLIGMGAIIMNYSVIGKNCIIGAGALVTQNTVIPDNSLVMGSPAKVKRMVTEEEILRNRINWEYYVYESKEMAGLPAGEDPFVKYGIE